jgi:hypothetical protein
MQLKLVQNYEIKKGHISRKVKQKKFEETTRQL